MWLRDSGAQVWPYVQLTPRDEHLRNMVAGVIVRQFKLINTDPYANAFNDGATGSHWESDQTGTPILPEVHERKWEIDSHCYPIRLAYHYWKTTGDESVFGEVWVKAVRNILTTFRTQQRKENPAPTTSAGPPTGSWIPSAAKGGGNPVNPVGLIVSSFRPLGRRHDLRFSRTVELLRRELAAQGRGDSPQRSTAKNRLARECLDLAEEVEAALKKYAVVEHPQFGKIYAFEVDGFGNRFLMDDANVPSLLAMPYLGDVDRNDPVYENTRRFVWSEANPYFFRGTAGEGSVARTSGMT